MRLAVELEPGSTVSARILAEWRRAWDPAAGADAVELAAAGALAALLDLKARCYDQGITVNAVVLDNG